MTRLGLIALRAHHLPMVQLLSFSRMLCHQYLHLTGVELQRKVETVDLESGAADVRCET